MKKLVLILMVIGATVVSISPKMVYAQSDLSVLPSKTILHTNTVEDLIQEVHFQVLLNLDTKQQYFDEAYLQPFRNCLQELYVNNNQSISLNSSLIAHFIVLYTNRGMSYPEVINKLVYLYERGSLNKSTSLSEG